MKKTKKAIIIGATSGIGEGLARVLAKDGYEVGLTGRRENLLKKIQTTLPEKSYIAKMDVAQADTARDIFQQLLAEMGDVGLIIINAGVSTRSNTDWKAEQQLIDINVTGFVAIAKAAQDYFSERGGGHIVGISSIAGRKGLGAAMAYSASKAFVSTYMQAMRQNSRQKNLNIHISDIRPGFVETPMTEGRQGMFWVSTLDKAVDQIYTAIRKRKRIVYVTRRWRLVAWLLALLPDWLFIRM